MVEETKTKCIILPGNGVPKGGIRDANWYGWAEKKIKDLNLFNEVILRDMPDPIAAKSSIWLPFITDELGADENTLIIGHSSGAVAAMRLLETTKLKGIILVAACHTDLGDAGEAAAGYYPHNDGSNAWQWDKMKENIGSWGITQFHSKDDCFIPPEEARHVAEHSGSKYHEFDGRSHFFDAPFPELIKECKSLFK